MDFAWTDAQRELHDRMRALGAELEEVPAGDRMARLASAGVLGLGISADHGGGDRGALDTAYAFEGLGRTLGDGGVLLAAGAHLFGVGMAVERLGTPAQKRRWLPAMARGERVATVAATEATAGSDVARVEAEIAPEGDGWLCRGEKSYVTFADRAGLFLFVGRAAGLRGLSVALVPAECEGLSVGARLETLGLRGARLAPVRFDGCRVDREGLLGKPGAGMAVFQTAMTFERALILAFRLGAMQTQLEESIAFARRRRIGGGPIARHQAVSHRLARMHARLESARLLVYRAAWLLDRAERAQAEAALAKWQLAEAAVASAFDAVALRGGAGYLEGAGLGSALDDAIGGSIHSGTSEVLGDIVARWLGL